MDQNEKAFQKQVATMASQVAVMAVNPLLGQDAVFLGSKRLLTKKSKKAACSGRRWETVVTSCCVLFVSHMS